LEAIIGAWSLGLVLLMPVANRFAAGLIGLDPAPLQQWSIAFLLPFLLLLPATFAMGGTLPAMERLVSRLRRDGWSVGGLYAVNTFGAVLGTLGATFFLVPTLGFTSTLLLLAAINLICAVGVYLGSARQEEWLREISLDIPDLPASGWLLTMIFMTGLLGIGYEVVIVRVISQLLENTVYTFASVLSVYLLGTALGAALYQRFAPRRGFRDELSRLLQWTLVACLIGVSFLWLSEDLYAMVRSGLGSGFASSVAGELAVALAVFFLPTLMMGATFSHLAQAARDRTGLGVALGVNTLGAALAPLLFGIILLPAWGSKTTLLVLSLSYLLLLPRDLFVKRLPSTMLPLTAAVGLLFMPLQLRFVTVPPGGELVEYREGVMAAVSVVSDARGGLHLKVNNRFQMGGTGSAYSDRRQAMLPLLLHPNPQRALFLGLGTGITFAAAADYPGLQADGVELVPEIIPLLPYFSRAQGEALLDPRLRIHVADARRFVSASQQQYDVIIADLFHPARDGAGSLYTVEHFAAVQDLLAEDGLFCQWLPLYQLDLETLRSIVRTYIEVFPEGSAYLAHFSLQAPILGLVSRTPVGGYSADWLTNRLQDKALQRVLAELRIQDLYDLFGHYLGGSRELREFATGAPINRDDHPYVMFQAPHFAYTDPQPSHVRLLKLVDRFRPDPTEVLGVASGASDTHQRLAQYWDARNRFLHLGVGMRRTNNAAELLTRIGQPLLELVRLSPDFDQAYQPLLAMARKLRSQDVLASKALLLAMAEANPQRLEAKWLIDQLFR
jgi:spermidine synthase